MWRLFFLLGLTIHLCANPFDEITPSTPDEIASLNGDLIVDGFVSAMSGQLALSEVDLHIKGAQDLIFRRTYVPPQILGRYHGKDERDRLELGRALLQLNTKGWVSLPHLWAGYNPNSPYFQVRDPQGYVLEFEIEGTRGILKASSHGCSNLRSGEPSSGADIRNIEFLVEQNQVRITWPNGTQRLFVHQFGRVYRLDVELLPNGKAIRYQYNNQALVRISATDATGKYTYAYLDRVGDNHYRGSDGREVQLTYEPRTIKGKNKKEGIKKAEFTFPVMTKASNPVYSNSARYNDRTLLTSYDALNYPISCEYDQQKDTVSRIRTFSTPSGSISFSYDPPVAGQKGGSTTVSYVDGAIVIYRFNSSLLLTNLENWFEGKLYNQKVFTYDQKQHVAKIETKDGEGNTLLTKAYQCDASGNPTLETHFGDFGTFNIKRTFSKNRLISESRDDGLGFEYTYLGDTHLLLEKSTLANGKTIRKHLYSYDEANNLIKEEEVGHTITTYELYKEGPHLHQHSLKEEKDSKGNLIRRIKYGYDQFGNVSEEEHFGSDGELAYSIQKTFDAKRNLLEETNPLGQRASFTYNARNRPIEEVPFSNRLTIEKTYDGKGRLIHLKEGDHETQFSYNGSDELIEKTDYLNLTTSYTYHPVHGKPTLIKAEPTIQEITHDPFGREILRKDAYGASTRILPNSYGDPLEVTYPDGGKGTFSYSSNGLLLDETDPDGLKTTYSYDPLGRLLSKKRGAYETNYTYDAYHLIQEKDPLGISNDYFYNLAHQKISEQRGGVKTSFSYDSLGFLASETRSGRKTSFQNDVLGRVIQKDVDAVLGTKYIYDPAGNIASISKGDPAHFSSDLHHFVSSEPRSESEIPSLQNDVSGRAVQKDIHAILETGYNSDLGENGVSISKGDLVYFSYDPYDRLVSKIDPDGAKTQISYEEGNSLLIKRTKDPRGIERIESYNANGLLVKKEIPGVALEEFTYDNALRLIAQDHLTFTYTAQGHLSSICEAGKRTTYWTHTLGGKIASKMKPDGTIIPYVYNAQGELTRMGSREFGYDGMGRLVRGSGFERILDGFGNITSEEFSSGLVIKSSYDAWNRPIGRVLPDRSQILYSYKGPFLEKVTRVGSNGSILYSHSYEQFDSKGHLLLERGLFSTSYSYDKGGRRISQKNPYFHEELAYDLAGNLIQKGSHAYSYDSASQLISESGQFTVSYDEHYNCIERNGEKIEIDPLNQRKDADYDLNGNLLKAGFLYDEFNQLIQTGTDQFTYDALGRRLASGSTSYFYIEDEEIGSFEKGQIQELKVLGSFGPVAIEVDGKPFAPVVDVQNTVRELIDWGTGKGAFENDCDAFGNGVAKEIPYAYVGKRLDVTTGLIYFGKRFYDPNLGRWLTPDPIGPIDHSNLYQYVFNNPYLYQDRNGESIGGYLLGLGQIVLGGTIMVGGFALEVVTLGGFTFGLGVTTTTGAALMGLGLATTTYHAQDISFDSRNNSGSYTISKNDPGPPRSNTDQNTQAEDAKKAIERQLGRKLNPREERKFHDHVTGQGYGYHEMIEEGYWLLGGS